MGSKQAPPNEEYASDEEVVAAIRALSVADRLRIAKVTAFRARAVSGAGLGLSADDLMQEAVLRTIDGKRRWRKSVKFVTHLSKTIRSIASHALDELKGGTVLRATRDEHDGTLDGVPLLAHSGNGERAAAASEHLAKIGTRFADDAEVGLVLENLAKGMTGPEIQLDLQITQTEYETIMTRLRRGVDRKEGWRL